MPRCMINFPARAIVRSADDNQISAFSIVEEFSPIGFPLFFPELSLFALWTLAPREKPSETKVEVKLLNNNHEFFSSTVRVDLRSTRTSRTIVRLTPLVIMEAGSLVIQYSFRGKLLSEYEISINPAVENTTKGRQSPQKAPPKSPQAA